MMSEGNAHRIIGRVRRIADKPQRSRRGDYVFRGLELSDAGCCERLFLILPETMIEFGRQDLYDFPLLCWEGAQIAILGVELNNTLGDGSAIYTVTPDTELILEPYRPVSVTEAVEAASCLRLADIRCRVAPDEPFWMAKGKMIHTLFDHLVKSWAGSLDARFEEAFREATSALMESLPGSKVSAADRALREEAARHFGHLKTWLEEYGDLFNSVEVEPDRISTRWGLKGRADAVFRKEDGETVLELKTGRVPVEEHLLQLYAYSLLFDDHCGRRPDGFLLYSASGASQMMKDQRRHLLVEGRNRVVSMRYSYTRPSDGPMPALAAHDCPRNGKCFGRSACTAIFGDGSGTKGALLAGSRKDYYDRWFRLLSLESWEAETQFARILDPYTLSQRVEEGVTVPIMEILTGTELPRFLPPDNPFSGGGPGKQPPPGEASAYADYSPPGMVRAFLMVGHSAADVSPGDQLILHRGDPCAKDALRAVVAHVESGLVAVSIRTPFYRVSGEDGAVHCQPVCQEDGQWYFDRLPFLKGHDVARQALFGFFSKADPSILHILITGEDATKAGASSSANHAADRGVNEPKEAQIMRRPARTDPLGASSLKKQGRSSATEVAWRLECDDLCFSEGVQAELNEEQEAAVKAALSNEPFHLIHGPPGTGKTRVLARLVRICLDLGERVLVACPTNVALDRLLISLIALGVKDFLRVGGSSNVSPEFIQAMQSAGIRSALLEELSAKAANSGEFLKAVRGKTLVGATAYQCAAHPLFLRQRFDRVIIDEAGQLDEPSSLGVLALGPRFVLGGDHLQLPPVVQVCSDADRGDCGLEQSLFERLLVSSQSSRVSRLRMQHRMNREIQDIPSRLFYDGTLYPSPEAAGRRLLIDPGVSNDAEINRILDPDLPVVFVNIEGTNIGKARPEEAMVASRIVKGLLASGVGAAEIGIITPYRLQQALIRRQLVDGRGGPAFTSVDTVDRFQGGEREVIILSLARSDGVTSFLADRKRLNVSLSRARSKLILLGHRPSLEEHPLFLSLLSGIERVNVNAPAP